MESKGKQAMSNEVQMATAMHEPMFPAFVVCDSIFPWDHSEATPAIVIPHRFKTREAAEAWIQRFPESNHGLRVGILTEIGLTFEDALHDLPDA